MDLSDELVQYLSHSEEWIAGSSLPGLLILSRSYGLKKISGEMSFVTCISRLYG